jgi:hypothetical protein
MVAEKEENKVAKRYEILAEELADRGQQDVSGRVPHRCAAYHTDGKTGERPANRPRAGVR